MMKKRIAVSILMALVIPMFFCTNANNTINTIIDKTRGKTLEHVQDVQTSEFNESDPSTFDVKSILGYDMTFHLDKYEKILTFPSPINQYNDFNDWIDIKSGGTRPYRLFFRSGGTVDVFNATDYIGIKYNVTYWNTIQYYTGNFTMQKVVNTVNFGNVMVLAGYNPFNNIIMVNFFELDDTGLLPSFNYIKNITIFAPSGFSVVFTDVRDVKQVYTVDTFISGRYVTTSVPSAYASHQSSFPFLYIINVVGSVYTVIDVMDYNSTSLLCNQFDDAILKVYTEQDFVTEKKYMNYDLGLNVSHFNIPLNRTLAYATSRVRFSYMTANIIGSGYDKYFVVNQLSISPVLKTISQIVEINTTQGLGKITLGTSLAAQIQAISSDTIVSSAPDFANGLLAGGFDKTLNLWNTWSMPTMEHGHFFDFFMPVAVHVPIGLTKRYIEIPFANAETLYIAELSNDIVAHYAFGKSHITIVSQIAARITHSQGTGDFEFTIYGNVQRNVTHAGEVIECGLVPILNIMQIVRYGVSVNGMIKLFNQAAVLVSPEINFIGLIGNYMDFYVTYKCKYMPLEFSFQNLGFLDLAVTFVVYEKYENGSYSQIYISEPGFTTDQPQYSSGKITMIDYSLQTSMIIQDSQMLNELHVFVGTIEYDPYHLFFLRSNDRVLVTDKITRRVLFNSNMLFADPLFIPMTARYQFFIAYFSTLDQFGLDYGLVTTIVNNTIVTSPDIPILSENANITVKDFAGTTIRSLMVNKYTNGTYVKIGLPLAQIIISNQYTNKTIDFYLTKGSTTIYYQLPSSTSFILRLALGDYHYKVKDSVTGEVLFDQDITISAAKTLSFGFASVTIPVLPPQGYTFLDTIISVAVFAGIVFIIMLGYNMGYFKRVQKSFVTKR